MLGGSVDEVLPVALFERLARRFVDREVEAFSSHWCSLDREPQLAVEQAVHACARHLPADAGVTGCEWFVRRAPASSGMEWHCDINAELWERHRLHMHPQVTSVLYFNTIGGPTLAVDQQACGYPGRTRPILPVDGVAFSPAANRFIFFGGDRLHAVGACTGDERPRITLAMHWWRERPNPPWSADPIYTSPLFDELRLVDPAPARPRPSPARTLGPDEIAALVHVRTTPQWP